jgi:hypothetical protein
MPGREMVSLIVKEDEGERNNSCDCEVVEVLVIAGTY